MPEKSEYESEETSELECPVLRHSVDQPSTCGGASLPGMVIDRLSLYPEPCVLALL